MRISLNQITSAVFISLVLIFICLIIPEKSYSIVATLYTEPASGVTPLEVRITCAVATNTSTPKAYTIDFGDGSERVTVDSNSYIQTFSHTYQSGLFKPICRVEKTIATSTETDPGNIIVAKWKFKTNGEIDTSPAIDDEGIIYIGSDDGKLYAVDPLTGNEIWRFQTGDQIKSSPAIGPDGIIYFGSTDNYFYAVRPNGALKWSFNIGDYIFSSPAISPDGRTIYVGASDNHLYAISSSNGDLKWKYLTGNKIISSPAIGFDGIEEVIYIGSLDKKLYALAADNGALKWTFSGRAGFHASPAVDQYGQIYVGECVVTSAKEYNFKFYSINVDGSKLWELDGGTGFYSSPAIGPDGIIYVGSWDGYFYALNKNGTTAWRVRTSPPSDINSSPAIDSNGIIYVGSKDGNFYAFESPEVEENDRNDWVYQTSAPILEASPTIGNDGTIYFASRDKCLYAVDPGLSRIAADSAWPMFHGGAKHQGFVENINIPTVISASPERNSVNIDITLKNITINFSPDVKESQIDVDSFQLVKINKDETEEKIDGYAFLNFVRYNNSGYHVAAVFNRLDDDIPLDYTSKYEASIAYLPIADDQAEADTLNSEVSEQEKESTTFSTTFTTAAEPEKDPDPNPKPDFSCFINSIR